MKNHSVLFVCLGNICRSPMAEYVLRHRAREAGVAHRIRTDSAGTSGWHDGENMHQGTRKILAVHGIDHQGFTSSKVRSEDFDEFDFITHRPHPRKRLLPRPRPVVHRRL